MSSAERSLTGRTGLADQQKADAAKARRYHRRRSVGQTRLERDLCEALAGGQLELRYQPIVDAQGCRVAAVEALLCWRHPKHGCVPPDLFVPLAERQGLIQPMTTWLVGQAQEELREILRAHSSLRLNVNLSALQVQPEVARGLCAQFEGAGGIGPERVTIEITEGSLLKHAGPTHEALSILRAAGCRIALDNFGAGLSSLGHLDQLPIDGIKIDRSFVQRLQTSPGAGKLIEAMLFVGHTLDLDTMAEGIETADHLATLAAKGCRYAQGCLFAKPLAAERLGPWLEGFRFPEDDFEAALCIKAQGGLPRPLTDNQETAPRLFVKHVPAAALFDREMGYLMPSDRWPDDIPGPHPIWRRYAAACAARGPSGDFVHGAPNDEGGTRAVEVGGDPRHGKDGRFLDYPGTARDGTAREAAKEALERQTSQLNLAAEIAGIGHWEVDLATGRVAWSENLYRIAGHTPETFAPIADDRLSIFHDDDRPRVAAAILDAAGRGVSYRIEARIRRPDGEVRHVVNCGRPVFDGSGRVKGFFGIIQDVTEAVLRERRLMESEGRLADYLAAASDWLWETDKDHRFVFVSAHDRETAPVWPTLRGRTRWEVAGAVAPEADPFWTAHLADLAARRPFRDFVYTHPLGDRIVHRQISGRPVFDEDGVFQGYRGVARDTTAQIEAERALAAKCRENELYKQLIETFPDIAYLKDTEHRFLVANPATVRDFGLDTAAELIGKTDFDFFSPELANRFRDEERAMMASGTTNQAVHDARRPNGERRVHLSTKAPLRDEAGALIGFVGVNKDVTELHEAREAAEAKSRENALYRQVIEALPDLIYVKDAVGRFLIANAATARFMGRNDSAELIGRSDFDFYDASDARQWRKAELRAMAADGPVRLIQPSFDADGEEGWMASLKMKIQDADGRMMGLIGVDRDVTEQRRAERALKASNARYRDLVDGSLQGILILAGRRLVFANPAFLAFMGFTDLDEARSGGRSAFARQPRTTRRRLAAWLQRALLGQSLDDRARLSVRQADGRGRRADLQVRGVIWEGALALQVTMIDVTRQVAYETELKREKHRLAREAREKANLAAALAVSKAEAEAARDRLDEAVTTLLDGFALFDAKDRLLTCSPAFAIPHGLPMERLIGMRRESLAARLRNLRDEDGRKALKTALAQPDWQNAKGTPIEVTYEGRWYELRRSRTPSGMTVILRSDITERKQAEAELRRLATVDALTGVFNRRHFVEQGSDLLARAVGGGRPATLLMLDIDHFKRINDGHGHAAGDRILVLVCECLVAGLRPSDLVARLGGEEFAVLLPQTSLEEGHAIAERLRAAVAAIKLTTDNGILSPTTSIGIAQSGDGENLDSLLRRADHALYAAKSGGRDRVDLAVDVDGVVI